MTHHHGLRSVTVDDLQRLDRGFHEAFRRGRSDDLEVIGYGEVSAIVAWPTPAGTAVCKRLPPIADRASLIRYEALLRDYLAALEAAGVSVVPTSIASVPQSDGSLGAYVLQPLVDEADLVTNALRQADPSRAASIFDEVFEAIESVAGTGVGLDAQLSNWAIPSGKLVYLDVTTPLLRDEAGRHRLDTALFLASLPWALRRLTERFLVDSLIDAYFSVRTVIVDLLGNLIKERHRAWIPLGIARANLRVERAITVEEVERYYRQNALMWEALLRLRRIDRAWQIKVRRRPYPFLLPGKIER